MATDDESPNVTRHSTETLDATGRRRAEEAALEGDTILRALLKSASEAVVIVGGDGRIVLFSARAEEMFGYSRNELIGQTVETLIPGQFRDAHVRYRADYVAHPRVRPMSPSHERVARRKDGTEFPVEIGLSLIETDGGGLTMSLIADISERKQAEAALRESEANLADIAGSLKEVVWSASPNTFETLYVNAAAEAVYGRPVAEFLANTHLWLEVIHPEDKERLARQVQASSEDDLPELEYRILRPDGEVRWLHGQAYLARDTSGHVTRIVGITTDITERKRTEDALRESEERFRSAFEHAAIGMAVTDISGRFLQVNRALSEMLGYSEQELLATNFQAITNPEDLNTGLGYMRQVLAGEINSCQFEKRYFHKLGHEVWALLSFSLVRDADRSPLYFIAQIQDITEIKRAEEALRESEELFRNTFEHAPIGMVLVSMTGRFQQVNQSMCEMLGYSEEELTSTTWQAITHPDDLDIGLDLMRRTLAGEMDSCQFDKRYFHKLGHVVWAQLSFSLVRDADGRPLHFISQIQDITRRKLAEEQLQVAREELEGRVERQLLRRNPYGLTFRELTVLHLVAAGKSGKEIGIDLGISPLTARKHISNILAKMDAASRTEAVARCLREGLLD